MCVYGMEGPGGYQLFGRTIQMWNSWRQTAEFGPGKLWLLEYFDQIRFLDVSDAELAEARAAFPHGAYPLRIEDTGFDHADHLASMAAKAPLIAGFKARQQAAFEAERQRWKDQGLDIFEAEKGLSAEVADLATGFSGVASRVAGNVWKVLVGPGDVVSAGAVIAIVESMKMEFDVVAPSAGVVRQVTAGPGRSVKSGDTILVPEDD